MITSDTIAIAGREIGRGHPAFLVAEVAQAHDGSLGLAHAFIDAAAEIGVDAIKFQTHIAGAESTLDEPFRVKFSRQDKTRFDYWRRMEFTPEQWAGLADHAAQRGLVFLSSAFSLEAVALLRRLNMPAWKIASGELASEGLLDAMAEDGRPFLVSSGMSGWSEIAATLERVRARGCPVAVMQCTSRYPTALEQVGLNVIDEMRRRFACPVGLSDHSGVVFPALAALARGAALVELHLTLGRQMFGPDVSSSLTPEEFRQIVAARNAFATMDSHPVDKDRMAEELREMRALFQRSLAPKTALPAGTVLDETHLIAKKPGTGIPVSDKQQILGRRLIRDVVAERLLTWEDLEARDANAP